MTKAYWLLIIISDRDFESECFKKNNHFIYFKFGDLYFFDATNFLEEQKFLNLTEVIQKSETKTFLYEGFDHPDKMQNIGLTPSEASYRKLRSCNRLEAEFTEYVIFRMTGMTAK